jgi:hypothetical protein
MFSEREQKLTGRRDPSASKVRYLVHLEDCRLLAANGITQGLSLLASISTATSTLQTSQQLWDAGIPFNERLEIIKKDLTYLNKELRHTEKGIEELQTMVRLRPFFRVSVSALASAGRLS